MQAHASIGIVYTGTVLLSSREDLVTVLGLFRRCGAGPAGTGHPRSLPNSSTSELDPTVRPFSISRLRPWQVEIEWHLGPTTKPWYSKLVSRKQHGNRRYASRPATPPAAPLSEPYRPFRPGGGLSKPDPPSQVPSSIFVDIACVCGVEATTAQGGLLGCPPRTSGAPPMVVV